MGNGWHHNRTDIINIGLLLTFVFWRYGMGPQKCSAYPNAGSFSQMTCYAQTEQIFKAAKDLGLAIKCHAEQLSNIGASRLAAEYQALSCDHLEYLDAVGVAAMAATGTVAVLLPGAYYFLKETQVPPINALRAANVPIAIATDCNPGSSPTTALLLMMNMACQLFQLSVEEVMCAVTTNAAKALGISDKVGIIAPKYQADLVLWSVQDAAELCYYMGSPIPHRMMRGGLWLDQ